MSRTRRNGFTLVEVLIVVVILGILAAIVVPQFTDASDEARTTNLATQVRTISSQIELYKAREGEYPPIATAWTEMISGGYLKSAPVNPVNGLSVVAAGTSGTATDGWHWDVATGAFGATYFDEATNAISSTP